jgi:hypothetical protein
MFSCSSGSDCCTVIDLQIGLEYVNGEGEDLLNPNTENYYNENDIKVFYLVNGEKKEIFRANLDKPKMLSLSPSHNERNYFIFSLSLNDLSTENVKTTYLQLDENDIDTITHTLQKTYNNNKIINKVWYNGQLPNNESWKTFKILK